MTIDLPLYRFSKRLFEEGVALVPWWKGTNSYAIDDLNATMDLIHSVGQMLALDAPCEPPVLVPQSALWSLQVVHWLGWQLLDRLSTEIALPQDLQHSEPVGHDPSTQWSVDMGFRFLRSLQKKGSSMSSQDPILPTIFQLGVRWPLSAIQVPADFEVSSGVTEERIKVIRATECLNRIWKSRNE